MIPQAALADGRCAQRHGLSRSRAAGKHVPPAAQVVHKAGLARDSLGGPRQGLQRLEPGLGKIHQQGICPVRRRGVAGCLILWQSLAGGWIGTGVIAAGSKLAQWRLRESIHTSPLFGTC